ncbi:DUF2059 domain-containing protein [Marinobacter sp. S6332]|uniref:DUF2059 domain-containing protein n=1 Tax=Marinobacter sp. S6332 TaxID=2926403 RepID=UPI001FF6828E|nr:DUF2059 domain-containing protein [Marinobacter sp. S6332]MCK0162857.1 DUF2059 domain-containing protein [Marinobacter sp. S6332]
MKLSTLVKPLLVTGLFLAGPAMAAPSAQQVLSASPIDDIVDRYPAMMSEGIREGLKRSQQLPPMVADTIGYVVSNSFRAADIEQQIVNNLERDLSGKQLEDVEGWYATLVARKISAVEIAASDPAVWKQIRAKAPELNSKYKGTGRAQMFARFDRAARATESAVDTTIAVQLGLATAMAAFRNDSANYDELKQKFESQRGTIRGVVEQQVYDSYLHTYEKISNQEMKLYIDFLESGPGSAFTKSVTRSIQQAITDPNESIGNQMVRFLAPQK